MPRRARVPGRDWVALTLAIGVCTAFNLITIGVLVAAWYRGNASGDYAMSENATQVLIAGLGGFIGILGGYVGGSAAERARSAERERLTAGLDELAETNRAEVHTQSTPPSAPTPLSDTPPDESAP